MIAFSTAVVFVATSSCASTIALYAISTSLYVANFSSDTPWALLAFVVATFNASLASSNVLFVLDKIASAVFNACSFCSTVVVLEFTVSTQVLYVPVASSTALVKVSNSEFFASNVLYADNFSFAAVWYGY